MKIFLYEWGSYLNYDIMLCFKELGINYRCFSWKFEDKNYDEKFFHWFRHHVERDYFDVLFSVNFWPLLSEIAQEYHIPYVAWCYDNPLNVRNIERTLGNSVNTVVMFDRIQANEYQNAGFSTVIHMPLAVNIDRLVNTHVTRHERTKYSCDVSLVGSLYESAYQPIRDFLSDQMKGYVDGILAVQQNLYGCYLLDELINQSVISLANNYIKKEKHSDFRLQKEEVIFAIASEITRRERLLLLSLMSKKWDCHLYSFHTCDALKNVKIHSAIDYVTQMPKVFACSTINLNTSLKCIQSGIPLRVLDIIASGGFLLSNYQIELAEYFTGDEVIMYESISDAYEKAAYFLERDWARDKIIRSGQEKIVKYFSMKERIKEILELTDA